MTQIHISFRTISFLALAFVLMAVAGCAENETESAPAISSSSYPQLAFIAPPDPPYEETPVLDDPKTTIWEPGYWSFNGSTYDWVSGEIIARPAPTATWAPSYWARREYGWAFVPGYWE